MRRTDRRPIEQEQEVVRVEVIHTPARENHVEGLTTGSCLGLLHSTREGLDLHVETDRLQVVLHEQGRRNAGARVAGIEDALTAAQVAARLRPSPGHVRPGRVDGPVLEPAHGRRHVLVVDHARVRAALVDHRDAVDRVVDGLLETDVAQSAPTEQRPVMIHCQVDERRPRVDEVLTRRTLPDAVLLTELGVRHRR